jgi:cell division septal protein FtsQ
MKFNFSHHNKILLRKKRDYHFKNLHNPFFHKDKKKAIFYVNGLLILLILFGLYYFMQHMDVLQIKQIEVNGGSSLTKNLVIELAQQQEQKKRFYIFSQDKLIFFKKNEYEEILKKQIILKNLSIKKNYKDRTLAIQLEERDSLFYLINQGQFYTLDKDGNLISIINELPATPTIPILEYSERNLMIGSVLTDSIFLSELVNLRDIWLTNINNLSILSFIVTDKYNNEITIKANQGFKVIFSRKIDIKNQIINLQNLLVRIQKENIQIKEYIDMGTEGWLYYK